jgi:hypothetical protein
MLSCSKTEHDDMASETQASETRDPRAKDERERRSDLHSAVQPPKQSGPLLLNDGPELIRDNHC